VSQAEVRPRLKSVPWLPYEGRRSLRSLAAVALSGLRMIWEAAPRPLALMLFLQVTGAAASGSMILLIRNLVAVLLHPAVDRSAVPLQPALLLVVLAYVAVSGGLQGQLQMVMGELVVWNANERLTDVTTAVDLAAYDDPDFHDLLERASQSVGRPFGMTQTLLGLLGSITTLVGFGSQEICAVQRSHVRKLN